MDFLSKGVVIVMVAVATIMSYQSKKHYTMIVEISVGVLELA